MKGKVPLSLFTALAAVLIVGLSIWGCSSSENVDLVRGVSPMSSSMSRIDETLNALKTLPADQRGRYLETHWPHLGEDVTYYLRQRGTIARNAEVERVTLHYGSIDKTSAESGDGSTHYGYVRDQIFAVVSVKGQPKPVTVIVECLNGTFATLDDIGKLQQVGSHTPINRFTIGYREGLIHYVDFPVAVDLAERHHLPLYRGKTQTSSNRITPDQARRLERETDRIQVTVRVFEGDTFDLAAGTYTPARRRS